jgi:hypothetical protein
MKTSILYLSLVLLTGPLASPANGQQTQAAPAAAASVHRNLNLTPGNQATPTWMRYRGFFGHYIGLEKAGQWAEEQGLPADAKGFRTHHQRAAGLTDSEGEILRQVVEDADRELKAIDAQEESLQIARRQQFQAYAQQLQAEAATHCHNPDGDCKPKVKPTEQEVNEGIRSGKYKLAPHSPEVDALTTQIQALNQDRERVILDHVDQLKSQLSEASFQKLDSWVNTFTRSSATTIMPSRRVRPGDPGYDEQRKQLPAWMQTPPSGDGK